MIRLIQVVPAHSFRLFGQMGERQLELSQKGGTFQRTGPRQRDRAKWSHKRYKGWINIQRGEGEVITAEIHSRSGVRDEWQILKAFLGWLDRNFGEQIMAMNIQYRQS